MPSNCLAYASKNGNNYQPFLQTQLWNTVHGINDNTVSPAHADRNADIAVAVYDDNTTITQCGSSTIPGALSGNHG